ncbi:hypothetical protein [Streptacidiphilus neutrinimicus]|nr:hypothetical protein [Streptacidiphilus neutrinimicus]
MSTSRARTSAVAHFGSEGLGAGHDPLDGVELGVLAGVFAVHLVEYEI